MGLVLIATAALLSLCCFALSGQSSSCGSTCPGLLYYLVDSSLFYMRDDCGYVRYHLGDLGTTGPSFVQEDGTIGRLEHVARQSVSLLDSSNGLEVFRCPIAQTTRGRSILDLDLHDLLRLPSGNVLVVAWEVYSGQELRDLGIPDVVRSQKLPVLPLLVEVTPDCEQVWEWHLADHVG